MDLFGDFDSSTKESARSINEIFREQLKTGNLSEALRSVIALNYREASKLMLEAGFSISGSSASKGQKEFWEACQREVARACRHKVDGWGLRDVEAISKDIGGADHEFDERGTIRGQDGLGDRGNGFAGRADSGSLGERVAGTDQGNAQGREFTDSFAGASGQGTGNDRASQQHEPSGAPREDGSVRAGSVSPDVKADEWVKGTEAEELRKVYSGHFDAKPGQPKPVKLSTYNGKPVTVFSVSYRGDIISLEGGELTPVEAYLGEIFTQDQLHSMWNMGIVPRGLQTGLLVQSRGKQYVVSRSINFLNLDHPDNRQIEQAGEEFDIEETQIGLAVDQEDAATLREYLAKDLDPATGKPIHSEGRRRQLTTELENLDSGISNAEEVLETAQKQASDRYEVGERVVLLQAANDDLVNRHGEVVEARTISMRIVQLYSNIPAETRQTMIYTVRTDEGTAVQCDHEDLAPEVERPRVVILDPEVDGTSTLPRNVFKSIDTFEKRAQSLEASAARARKQSNKEALRRQADSVLETANKYRRVWEEWSWQNPEAAQTIEGTFPGGRPAPAAIEEQPLPAGVRMATFRHTQTGEKKYSINLEERVDRQVFMQLNKVAGKYGGHWSSFGRNGAIPGFLFKSEEDARTWISEIAPIIGLEIAAPAIPQAPEITTIQESAEAVVEPAEVNRLPDLASATDSVAVTPITNGIYKGGYQARALEGLHAGITGDVADSEDEAREELAKAMVQREQEAILPDAAEAAIIAAAPAQELQEDQEEYVLSHADAQILHAYFNERFGDEPLRIETFSRMVGRAANGIVTERGSSDAFKDPVKWAIDWVQIARGIPDTDLPEVDQAETPISENTDAEGSVELPQEGSTQAQTVVLASDYVLQSEHSASEELNAETTNTRDRAPSMGVVDIPTDFVIQDDADIGKGGAKTKYRDNIEAIRLLKQLEETGRRATYEDQQILVKYVGWGGLKGVFNPDNQDWNEERIELTGLLTAEEFAAARRSQLDAHYTSPAIIDSIYGGLQHLGFDGGQMLEPAIGIGHFVGKMPREMRSRSHIIGAELDVITGKIAQHLYPSSDISIGKGFEQISMPANFFDAAVGNPPFGNQSVFDTEHPELNDFSLHNFFFAKSMDKVRPGGLMSMVVSRYFMDSQDSAARLWIAERAKLLGAFRLPNSAFKENAGTEVVSDIIFLQKLEDGEEPNLSWVETVEREIGDTPLPKDAKPIRTNQYFVDHPAHILGAETVESNQYTSAAYTVYPEADWENALAQRIVETLPKNVYRAGISGAALQKLTDPDVLIPEFTKVGALFVDEKGAVYQRLADQFNKQRSRKMEFKTAAAESRALGLIKVRNSLRTLMRSELSVSSNEMQLAQLRNALNRTYDDFVRKHGYINSLGNRRAFADDPDLPLLESLEPDYDAGVSPEVAKKQGGEARKPSAGKADIFRRRVLVPHTEVSSVETAKDGLIASLNYRGRVDIEYIGDLYGKPDEDVIAELSGLIYQDPDRGWVTADEYLSGNVKHKLVRAKEAAAANPVYSANVGALEAVQPEDILPMDIRVRLGSPWVPAWVVEQFAREMWSPTSINVSYIPSIAQWSFHAAGGDPGALTSRWGTADVPAPRIVDSLLNNRSIVVRENLGTAREPHWVVLEKETEAARAKAEEVGQKFKDWIWQDHDRSEKLARIYNDTMNTNRERSYDGSHLTLPGASPAIQLRPSQKAAIWRGVAERSVLLDHRVGAGKTFTKIGIAMEMRRLGIIKKPMLCVPNHLVRQWRDSFYELYPGANVLAATEADFEKENRHKLFARITTGDWDAVVIGHSSLKKIGLPEQTEQAVLQEMMDDISYAIERIKRDRGDRNVTRDMERIKANLEAKMNKLNERGGKKDNVVTFDELGVDGLFVDELDEFKNLFFTTTMQQVAGLGNPAGSAKAFDLFVKRRWLVERYGEDAVFVGGTGTPISNSLVEMFTMQRYMIYDELRRRGIHLLDAWAGYFGDVQHVYEVHPSGSGYRLSTRFAKFVNMPELMTLYKGFADVVTLDDLKAQAEARGHKFPIPRLAGGKPNNIVADRSKMQEFFFGIPVFERDSANRILFEEAREPQDLAFHQAPDNKWVWTSKGSVDQIKNGKFATREEAVEDYVSDFLTPQTGFNKNSILWQYENLRELTRKTKGKVNALSITNSARKAGLDYRLIDPEAPDYPDSKINKAADEIVRIYHKWHQDRGTQLVFCDLSVPLSERERIGSSERQAFIRNETGELRQVKVTTHPIPDTDDYVFYTVKQGRMYQAYDAITGNILPIPAAMKRSEVVDAVLVRATAGLEWFDAARGETAPIDDVAIDAWRAENEPEEQGADKDNNDQVSLTDLLAVAGKSRFSVYDDLRAKLIERGIPEDEIAFIHDYDTTKKKAELFKAINDGRKRITLGSTPKMGAGTNVQERLVGLHHLDCPWRPRDLEQRDGRIERQGNQLYERDPEGFEVEILRYATRQTYDTRMWQIVEHKARGVQQLRKAGKAEREIDDLGGEAASAADMKAAASGNPLILEEIRLRNEVKSLDAQRDGWLRSRHDLGRQLSWHRSSFDQERRTKDIFGALIEYRDAHSHKDFRIRLGGRDFADRQAASEMVNKLMVNCLKSKPGEFIEFAMYRGFEFHMNRESLGVGISFKKPDEKTEYNVVFYHTERDKFSPSGLLQRMDNRLAEFEKNIESAVQVRDEAERQIPLIQAELEMPFGKDTELNEKREAHRAVISALKKAGGTVQLTEEMRAELKAQLPERIALLSSHGIEVNPELIDSLLKAKDSEQVQVAPVMQTSLEDSKNRVIKVASELNLPIDFNPREKIGLPYAGKIVAIEDHHVVQDIGRMLVAHRKADLIEVPAQGAYLKLSYEAGTGPALTVGRSALSSSLTH